MNGHDEKIRLLKLLKMKDGLPHLYGHPLYQWQMDFIAAITRMSFLVAANQAGKSAGLIIKNIDWITNPDIWKRIWGRQPRQLWYFYPSRDVAEKEFQTKWKPDYLPRNEYKKSSIYGWEHWEEKSKVAGIRWNNGTILYFLTYEQKPSNLQASTVDMVSFDEEPPEAHFNEMVPRTSKGGMICSAFTATLGQEYLRQTIEGKGTEEKYPDAWKRQVSLYDCLTYSDGTPSQVWTIDKILAEASSYTSEADIQRRIHGRFVKSESVLFQTFSRRLNIIPPVSLGSDFLFYAGVDAGSGGQTNHPAALIFVAVHKSFLFGHVVKAWRGDGIITTSQDIVRRYCEMAGTLPVIQCSYDYAGSGTDVGILGMRLGLPFVKANKDRATGISILNTLWKSRMLTILDDPGDPDPEMAKLVTEISVVTSDAKKMKVKDDLSDGLRYCVAEIPWHFKLNELQSPVGPAEEIPDAGDERRKYYESGEELTSIQLEMLELAEAYNDW